MNAVDRKFTKVYTPPVQPGFLGLGHTARPVIQVDFAESDPFIMLMDDRLDKTDHIPVGGPHPHAGFETVTLILDGEIGEGQHALKQGDFEIMTAGSGIVHTETIAKPVKMRVLQLWLNLPKAERKAPPRLQRLAAINVPTMTSDGVNIRVYSGAFAGVSSPIKNYTPLIVAEVRMDPGATLSGTLPADFSTFLYVLSGSVSGKENNPLLKDQVGWLQRHDQAVDSQVEVTAGQEGAHFVLYSAQPQRHEIVSHGPFIADSLEEIKQLYADYRAGRIAHIHEVKPDQKIVSF